MEKKIIEFEENFLSIEAMLAKLEEMVDSKPSMDLIDIVRDDKVSTKDIYQYIPDQEAINKAIVTKVQQ